MTLHILVLYVLSSLLLSAQEGAVMLPPGSVRQTIGPGDAVAIQAFHCEEISRTWRVGESGDISLPLVGKVQAAGLSPEAMEQVLTTRLKGLVKQPQVSVQIVEHRSQPVTVTGAVERPGVIQLQGDTRLFEVLVLAGGPKNAGETLTLARQEKHGPIPSASARLRMTDGARFWTAELSLAEVLDRQSQAANLRMLPEDSVTVAQKQLQLVHVIGEVTRPGSVELLADDSVSVTKLVAVAGGLTRAAKASKAVIRKIGHDGVRADVAVIDLRQVMSGKAADIELSGGDVLIIPSSQLITFLTATSQSALNAGIFSGLQVLARF